MLRRLFSLAAISLPLIVQAGFFGPLLKHELNTFPTNCCAIHLIHISGGEFLM